MAVRRTQYVREFEKHAGKGMEKAHEKAVKAAVVKPAKKKKKKEGWKKRLARGLKELYGGKKTYAGRKYGPAKRMKK